MSVRPCLAKNECCQHRPTPEQPILSPHWSLPVDRHGTASPAVLRKCIKEGRPGQSASVILYNQTHHHASQDLRKGCQEVRQCHQGHCQGRQEKKEGKEEGVLCHRHLQGPQAGAP